MYKTVISTKEQKIIDLEAKVTQTQTTISTVLERNKEIQEKEKMSTFEWKSKYQSINTKLDSCLSELRDCKSQNKYLESELSSRDEKISNLSFLKENLQIKLSKVEEKLNSSETARLSLSEDL